MSPPESEYLLPNLSEEEPCLTPPPERIQQKIGNKHIALLFLRQAVASNLIAMASNLVFCNNHAQPTNVPADLGPLISQPRCIPAIRNRSSSPDHGAFRRRFPPTRRRRTALRCNGPDQHGEGACDGKANDPLRVCRGGEQLSTALARIREGGIVEGDRLKVCEAAPGRFYLL